MKSTNQCEAVEVKLESHPNADSLSLCPIFNNGYICVLRTEDWKDIKRAIYIPPDSLVDTTRPEFSFLAGEKRLYEIDSRKVYARIKAKKLRGVVSFGLCVPAPENAELGEDHAERLGVIHFDEEVHTPTKQGGGFMSGGEVETPPNCYFIKYDVDSLRRYKNWFVEGEPVWCSEKVHGQNFRVVYADDKFHIGSRNEWKREYASKPNIVSIANKMERVLKGKISDEELEIKIKAVKEKIDNWNPSQNHLWKLFRQSPYMERFCKNNPNHVLYGECIGVQDLKYGLKQGELDFLAFDILRPDGQFMDVDAFLTMCEMYKIPRVPTLTDTTTIPFNFDEICKLAEGTSLFAKHIREGCVVKPMIERRSKLGRVCLKVVGAGYLERA